MKKKFIRYLIYISTKIFSRLVLILPYKFAVSLGGFLGLISAKVLKHARKKTITNLSYAFPEKSIEELNKITDNVFISFGKDLFEFLLSYKLSNKDLSKLIEIEGKHYIDEALKRNKGVIVYTAHLGNWEFLAMYLTLLGYPLHVIAKKLYDDRLNDLLVDYRARQGVKTILRTESTKEILKVLKENEILGMLIDQDTKVKGCFVNFFNRPAYTPSNMAALALKYDSSVIPLFIRRINNSKHVLTVQKPVELVRTDNLEKDIETNTANFTKIIENTIKEYPEQWVWVHDRWKTKK
jgi:Kdo2-lipid IVA lauroyltransferase/acyltransferase